MGGDSLVIDKLRQSLKAHYDINNDEIIGCEEGTLIWHHEYRHKLQYNSDYVKEIASWLNVLMVSIGTVLLLLGIRDGRIREAIFGVGLLALPMIAFHLLIELDAWQYCLRKSFLDKDSTTGEE
jgi:hypothetical protein